MKNVFSLTHLSKNSGPSTVANLLLAAQLSLLLSSQGPVVSSPFPEYFPEEETISNWYPVNEHITNDLTYTLNQNPQQEFDHLVQAVDSVSQEIEPLVKQAAQIVEDTVQEVQKISPDEIVELLHEVDPTINISKEEITALQAGISLTTWEIVTLVLWLLVAIRILAKGDTVEKKAGSRADETVTWWVEKWKYILLFLVWITVVGIILDQANIIDIGKLPEYLRNISKPIANAYNHIPRNIRPGTRHILPAIISRLVILKIWKKLGLKGGPFWVLTGVRYALFVWSTLFLGNTFSLSIDPKLKYQDPWNREVTDIFEDSSPASDSDCLECPEGGENTKKIEVQIMDIMKTNIKALYQACKNHEEEIINNGITNFLAPGKYTLQDKQWHRHAEIKVTNASDGNGVRARITITTEDGEEVSGVFLHGNFRERIDEKVAITSTLSATDIWLIKTKYIQQKIDNGELVRGN